MPLQSLQNVHITLHAHTRGKALAQRLASRRQRQCSSERAATAESMQSVQKEEQQVVPSHMLQRLKALEMEVQQAYEVCCAVLSNPRASAQQAWLLAWLYVSGQAIRDLAGGLQEHACMM
jgi:hypothetical protein